jgi:hypothetical protein
VSKRGIFERPRLHRISQRSTRKPGQQRNVPLTSFGKYPTAIERGACPRLHYLRPILIVVVSSGTMIVDEVEEGFNDIFSGSQHDTLNQPTRRSTRSGRGKIHRRIDETGVSSKRHRSESNEEEKLGEYIEADHEPQRGIAKNDTQQASSREETLHLGSKKCDDRDADQGRQEARQSNGQANLQGRQQGNELARGKLNRPSRAVPRLRVERPTLDETNAVFQDVDSSKALKDNKPARPTSRQATIPVQFQSTAEWVRRRIEEKDPRKGAFCLAPSGDSTTQPYIIRPIAFRAGLMPDWVRRRNKEND